MKKVCIVAFAFLLFINITAQQRTPHISFRKVDHEFGKIKEAAGPVSVTFSFINTGSSPIIIQDVASTCGCTTPEYTKKPVMPGDSGFVKAIFDPNGRPGLFTKDITVKSNADNSPIVLRIKGTVDPRELKLEEQYRYSMGVLKLETSHIGYGRINNGEIKSSKVKLINTSTKPVSLGYKNLPAYIKVKSPVQVLKPKEASEIEFTYNSKIKNDWGFLIDYVNFTIDGKADPSYKITLTAEINEDFSKLTAEQRANAPFIEFENPNFDFSAVKEGTVVEHTFKFTNKGKTDLHIRKVSSTCNCTVTAIDSKVIKPGQSGFVKASFNTRGYRDNQSKPITIITNDPKAALITLTMKGLVRTATE